MRTSRRVPVLLAVFAALVLSSFAQQSSKAKSAENATVALLQLHSAYQQASPAVKPQLLLQIRNAAAQRQQLLSPLIQTNPADVLTAQALGDYPRAKAERLPALDAGESYYSAVLLLLCKIALRERAET